MKTLKYSMGVLMLAVLLGGVATDLQAQGRGRGNEVSNNNPGRGHDKENNPGRGHHGKDFNNGNNHDRDINSGGDYGRRHDNDYDHGKGRDQWYGDRDYYDRNNNRDHYYRSRDGHRYDNRHRYVTYNHHRHSHPSWAPAYGYRYNTRYIYYQDYNVYYDCHRDVFVVFNGRNWVVSTRIPDVMFRVDFGRTRVAGVDYWDDDFDFYLKRRRPAYVTINAGW